MKDTLYLDAWGVWSKQRNRPNEPVFLWNRLARMERMRDVAMNWKKKFALLLSVLLVLMLVSAPVAAEETPSLSYLALGDSISYGLTDFDPVEQTFSGGYTVRFYAGALASSGYTYENLSWPGDTTLDLLGVIGKEHKKVQNADVITISIGSNHLLGPAIAAIVGLYGVDPADFSALDGSDMIFALAQAVQADWFDGGLTPVERFASLVGVTPEAAVLNETWSEGAAMFARKWPLIISKIRKDNPDATIIVNNVYNPLTYSVLSSQANPGLYAMMTTLFTTLDGYTEQINDVIDENSEAFNYDVVDTYDLFDDESSYFNPMLVPLAFNIPAALMLPSTPGFDPADPADFMPFFFACNPHPTAVGHGMITGAVASAWAS